MVNEPITREQPGWQLAINSAEAYERHLVPRFMAPGAAYLLDLAAVTAGDRVLDVACGTGIVARTAAGRIGPGGSVTGLDLNESMLAVARAAAAAADPPIEWRVGDAAALPFPEGSFDAVICQQGLQFFPDRPSTLREMHRVLAPGGRIALGVMRGLDRNPAYRLLATAVTRHLGSELGAMLASPFSSLSVHDLRRLLSEAGLHEARVLIGVGPVRFPSVEEFLTQELASSPLADRLRSLSAEARTALVADLEVALDANLDDDGVTFPAETYFAYAVR